MNSLILDVIVDGYIQAVNFSNEFESNYLGISQEEKEKIKNLIKFFFLIPGVQKAFEDSDYSEPENQDSFGMDLYFSRNGHGVGFWEADYCNKEQANLLQLAATELGESKEYLDGRNYLCMDMGYLNYSTHISNMLQKYGITIQQIEEFSI